jgi:preprotein translocase subunit SecA
VQLDLKALAENADAETLAEINRLRQAEDDLRSRFAVPSDAAKLDWSQLEGRLLSTGLVESLRKAFESLEPPSLEAEREELLQRIDSSFEPLLKEAQELAQEAEKRLKSLEQMMRELEYVQKNLSSLSVDELLARRPDLAEEVEADLKQSRWFKV